MASKPNPQDNPADAVIAPKTNDLTPPDDQPKVDPDQSVITRRAQEVASGERETLDGPDNPEPEVGPDEEAAARGEHMPRNVAPQHTQYETAPNEEN